MQVPLPIVISKEGKWFVASCPVLGIATQGKTEQEVKAMMEELINDYFKDKDTPKPKISTMMQITITNILVNIPKRVFYAKTTRSS
ncbi:hypothetical protein DRN74_02595 [Candidatus Micrarchaeota archaeon]|nr:MAG: hypothetical protein DRN74_02595 [Candidatus Micrarchaeota archaeon]